MELLHIGREATNDIVISDDTVSGQHAQLIIEDQKVTLVDLNSRNGSFVNGEQIDQPYELKEGDMVVLGATLFEWQSHLPGGASSVVKTASPKESTPIVPPRKKRSKANMTLLVTACALLVFLIGFVGNIVSESDDDALPPDSPDNQINIPLVIEDTTPAPPAVASPVSEDIIYDFSCLEDDEDMGLTTWITMASELENEMVDAMGLPITITEEEEYGDMARDEMAANYTMITSGSGYAQVQRVGKSLVNRIASPKGYHFQFHLMESSEINAFTIGGQVFITTAMMNFLNNEDELACVLGHEIGHNELGHLNLALRKSKTANEVLGSELGNFSSMVYSTITTSFGQRQEAHCDFFGVDLAISAGYDGCASETVWTRMSENESDFNIPENFFRSHPFSSKRAECSSHHMLNNHNQRCFH